MCFHLNTLRVGSVKTQLTILSIIHVATCFDSYSHHQAKFLNHIQGTPSKSAHFWDSKVFKNVRKHGYK